MNAHEIAEQFVLRLDARDWAAWTELMTADVVYEVPQSRERIRGRDRYLQFNQEYPGDWHVVPKVVIGEGDRAAVWFDWRVGGAETADAQVFFELCDGLIVRITDFWPEPYEPPPGREHLTERW